MALAILLYFVGCFGFYRTYWSGKCHACPSEWYPSKFGCGSKGFELCPTSMWHERPCGALCEGRCCRAEEDLCTTVRGGLEATQSEVYHPGSIDACAEKCALDGWEGMQHVITDNNCYCLKDIGALIPSKEWFNSCTFTSVPAYKTQTRRKCNEDNGQVLSPSLCKLHLPHNTDEFGKWNSEINTATKPSGCILEGDQRYWNQHTDGAAPENNVHLICRGSEPITVGSSASTGICPGGQQLTEYECQYQVVGYGTWHRSHDSSSATCGCYQVGNLRYYNRNEGACNSPGGGELMVCKKIDPLDVCQQIQESVEDSESDGEPVPEEIEYMGQHLQVKWNVIAWNPKMECNTTSQELIKGPSKCSDQGNCGVEFTAVSRHSRSWNTHTGASISGKYGMEFEAGIPLIAEIKQEVEIGAQYDFGLDFSGSKEMEQSETQHLACGNYQDLMINCYIFAINTAFNTTATISPQFLIVEEGASKDDPTLIDCNDEYGINMEIEWEAQTGNGYEARDVPICTDTPNGCVEANQVNCIQNDYIAKNCPESCSTWGLGPAPCPSGAECGFTAVDPENNECPQPADLNTATTYRDCYTVFNGPPVLCQATMEFPEGNYPEDWKVQNCPDQHGNYYNIFKYSCKKAEEAEQAAKLEFEKVHGHLINNGYDASTSSDASSSTSSHASSFPWHASSTTPSGSYVTNGLKDKDVEKAFDVLDEEAEEIRKFNARLVKVNRVLRTALEELAN